MALVAVVCYGFAINIAAPLTQRYGSLPVMARMLGLASIWTLPFGLVEHPADPTFAWSSFVAVAAWGSWGRASRSS